jgi:hypothetical protein
VVPRLGDEMAQLIVGSDIVCGLDALLYGNDPHLGQRGGGEFKAKLTLQVLANIHQEARREPLELVFVHPPEDEWKDSVLLLAVPLSSVNAPLGHDVVQDARQLFRRADLSLCGLVDLVNRLVLVVEMGGDTRLLGSKDRLEQVDLDSRLGGRVAHGHLV